MKTVWKYGTTLVAAASLVTVVLLATGWGSAVAAQVTSVLVTNTAANPVPTKAADNPALQPVEATEEFPLAAGDTGGGGTLYTVPAGKRLVIETATVGAQLPAGQRATANLLVNLAGASGKTGPGIGVFEVPMSLQFDNGTSASLAGSLGSHMYADAGTDVDVSVGRGDGTGAADFSVALSGYLVNTP